MRTPLFCAVRFAVALHVGVATPADPPKRNVLFVVADDVLTLSEHFKANGYTTRCVGKILHNWHAKEKGDRPSWSADEFLHYTNHGDDKPQLKGDLPDNLAKRSDWSYDRRQSPSAATCLTRRTTTGGWPPKPCGRWRN